jgi:glycerophosphoryl diester phosphodiesterase
MHDDTVDRTTDGTGNINNLTDAQLAQLEAGSWFSPAYAGEKVPKLVDAMVAARGRGDLFLDLKQTGLGPQIVAALSSSQFSPSNIWLWVGTNASYAAQLHSMIPEGKIFWGGDEQLYATDPQYFSRLANLGVYGFDVAYYSGNLTPGFVAAATAAGFYVSTYTINDPTDMRTAIGMGIDAMETDFPLRLHSLFDIDLNGDAALDAADWQILRANAHTDLSGLSFAAAYARGDLDGNQRNDHADFVLFKQAYIDAHGAAAFAALVAVPEPKSLCMAAAFFACVASTRPKHRCRRIDPGWSNRPPACGRR